MSEVATAMPSNTEAVSTTPSRMAFGSTSRPDRWWLEPVGCGASGSWRLSCTPPGPPSRGNTMSGDPIFLPSIRL